MFAAQHWGGVWEHLSTTSLCLGWESWAHRNKHAQSLLFSRKLLPGHPGSSAVLRGSRTQEQKSQTHNVERDPALAPESMEEKAAPVTVKHSCKERHLPTPAVIQWALWHRHSSLWKREQGKGNCPPPPKELILSLCSAAASCELSLSSLLRLPTKRCVYIPHVWSATVCVDQGMFSQLTVPR